TEALQGLRTTLPVAGHVDEYPVRPRGALALHHGAGEVLERQQGRTPRAYQRAEIFARCCDLDGLLIEDPALDRSLQPELPEEAGHEGPTDLALLLERHSLGHVRLLRFRAPRWSLLGLRPPRGAIPRDLSGCSGARGRRGVAPVPTTARRAARAGPRRRRRRRGRRRRLPLLPSAGLPRRGRIRCRLRCRPGRL